MFYIICIYEKKRPWGWISATFCEKPLENLLWLIREDHIGYCQHIKLLLMRRQEGEHSWQSCCLFQLRNVVNNPK